MREKDIGRVVSPVLLGTSLSFYDMIFAQIPDWKKGDPQKRISIPSGKFFSASCETKDTHNGPWNSREQFEGHLIREVILSIGGRVIAQSLARTEHDGVLGAHGSILRGAEFPIGENKVTCTFNTRDGKVLTAEASIEIVNDIA